MLIILLEIKIRNDEYNDKKKPRYSIYSDI